MKKLFLVFLAIALAFSFGLVACSGGEEEEEEEEEIPFDIDFYQIDFDLDGTIYQDTDWGSVDFTFTGEESIMYFNLAVNGAWQVQNVPVLSIEGVGVSQSISFAFDLGVPSGTDVTSLDYGYTFTDIPTNSMPAETETAVVFDQEVVAGSGAADGEIPPLQPAKPLIGGAVAAAKKRAHADFPNQECDVNECCPAAVSNSLKFLNEKHNLGLNDNDLSIAKMKEATKWESDGCWIDHNDSRPEGARNAWWEDKKAYMENNNILVTTRKITDLSELAAEIDAGQDIELQGDWHTAAIVGIKDLGGGKYQIDVAHDTKQGQDGGTKTETITYDPNTKKFTGSPGFFCGSSFRYAVVECPRIPPGIPPDASIEFDTWTINGQPVPPGTYEVPRSTIIDIRYKVHVDGQPGAVVTVQEASWLNIHYVSGEEPSVWAHAVNAPGAVSMDTPATKVHQMTSVEGEPAPHCTNIPLLKCVPVNLDVQTEWTLVVCTDYAKTINWLHIGQVTDEEVLFDLQALPGQSYTLYSYSSVELEGDENPENDDTDWSPALNIAVIEE